MLLLRTLSAPVVPQTTVEHSFNPIDQASGNSCDWILLLWLN